VEIIVLGRINDFGFYINHKHSYIKHTKNAASSGTKKLYRNIYTNIFYYIVRTSKGSHRPSHGRAQVKIEPRASKYQKMENPFAERI